MGNSNIIIQQRTESFSIRIINVYCVLNKREFNDAGKILAKQFLRSGTSIGENCAEAVLSSIDQLFYF
jgi:four helix bundle protein